MSRLVGTPCHGVFELVYCAKDRRQRTNEKLPESSAPEYVAQPTYSVPIRDRETSSEATIQPAEPDLCLKCKGPSWQGMKGFMPPVRALCLRSQAFSLDHCFRNVGDSCALHQYKPSTTLSFSPLVFSFT